MIDKVITSFAAAVTVGYGATQSFDRVSTTANTSASIYTAAGGLLSADPAARASAEARMYQAAAHLQPIVDSISNH